MRIRKNVLSLSEKEFRAFIAGLEELKKGSKADVASRYDAFVQCHYRASAIGTPWPGKDPTTTGYKEMRSQPHFGPAFLPWHRLFIYEFEKALGNAMKDDSLGLPYWDWSTNNESERFKIFESNALTYMGGARVQTIEEPLPNGNEQVRRFVTDGPFGNWYQWRHTGNTTMHDIQWDVDLRRGIERADVSNPASRARVSETLTQLDDLLNRGKYDESPWKERNVYLKGSGNSDDDVPFRPQLEGNFHDAIHKWIGGMTPRTWGMGSLASPNDPIFYLHHSNIDRIWAMWQAVWQGKKNIQPYVPENDGPPFHNLYDKMEGLPAGSKFLRPVDALDYYGKLGYKYDDVDLPSTSPVPSTPPAAHLASHPNQPQNAALANGGAATPGLPAQNQQANIVHNGALV